MLRETDARAPASVQPKYEARFFGPFRVLLDGRSLGDRAWRRASARTLLKWFLLNPGELFRSSELYELLWPGQSHANNLNRIHVTLHHLRRVLEPGLSRRQQSTFIRSDRNGRYRFDFSDCWWVDAFEVQSLSKAAKAARKRGDALAGISMYRQLLDYYEQTFLPEDLYEDTFATFRATHDRDYDDALHQLLKLYLGTGDSYAALSCAMRILDRDPYSEDAVSAIVQLNLRQGNITGALLHLEEFLGTVKRDLGITPSQHLLGLRERIYFNP